MLAFCSPAALRRAAARINALFAGPRDRLSPGTKIELGLQLILTGLYETAADDRMALLATLVRRLVRREPPAKEGAGQGQRLLH